MWKEYVFMPCESRYQPWGQSLGRGGQLFLCEKCRAWGGLIGVPALTSCRHSWWNKTLMVSSQLWNLCICRGLINDTPLKKRFNIIMGGKACSWVCPLTLIVAWCFPHTLCLPKSAPGTNQGENRHRPAEKLKKTSKKKPQQAVLWLRHGDQTFVLRGRNCGLRKGTSLGEELFFGDKVLPPRKGSARFEECLSSSPKELLYISSI